MGGGPPATGLGNIPKKENCSVLPFYGFLKILCRDFSDLLHAFVQMKAVTWICQSYYMDLSNLLHGFVEVVMWILKSCSIYFSPFPKQN